MIKNTDVSQILQPSQVWKYWMKKCTLFYTRMYVTVSVDW